MTTQAEKMEKWLLSQITQVEFLLTPKAKATTTEKLVAGQDLFLFRLVRALLAERKAANALIIELLEDAGDKAMFEGAEHTKAEKDVNAILAEIPDA